MSLWCVVVTYNRPAVAKTCVDGLLGQTCPPDHVLIVENSEQAAMARVYASEPQVQVVRPAGGNIGGSACFALGTRVAFERGAGSVVLAADDFKCDPTMLEELIKALSSLDRPAILVAVTYTEEDHSMLPLYYAGESRGHFGWPFCHTMADWPRPQRLHWTKCLKTLEDLREFASSEHVNALEVLNASFHGMLIPRSVFDRIGGPRADFFMYGDDVEYCVRAQKHGIPVLLVPQAGGRHRVVFFRHRRLGVGRLSLKVNDATPRVAFYLIRNSILMTRLYDTPLCRALTVARILTRALRIMILGRGPLLERVSAQVHAIADGLARKLESGVGVRPHVTGKQEV